MGNPHSPPQIEPTPTHGMKSRLVKGAVWLALTRAIVNLVAFANTLLLARLLMPADFGLVAIATTVSEVVSSITDLSLANALIQHNSPDEDHYHSAWSMNLARAALLALIIAALAIPLSQFYGDPRLENIFFVLASTTLLSGAANPKLVVFKRQLIFWQEFALIVSQKVIGLLVALVVALLTQSYWALIAGLVATQLVATALSFLLIPFKPKIRINRARELLSFSVWLSLGQAISTLNWRFDNLVIGYLLGTSPLGFYTLGNNLALLPTRESTLPLAQGLFPAMSRLQDDLPRLRSAYQRAQAMLTAVALPLGCGFAVIAEPLILLALGSKWLPAAVIIQFLSSIFALQTLSSALQPLAMAVGQTKSLFMRDTFNFVIRIPLIIVGMVMGGLNGIVYARCVSGLISTFINMHMVKRILDLSIADQLKVNLRSLLSCALMVVATSALLEAIHYPPNPDKATLIATIAAIVGSGALTYILTMYLLWRLQGRPQGPERQAIELCGALLVRIAPRFIRHSKIQ